MNRAILNSDVQQYIDQHLHDDITKIALRKSPFSQVSASELAEQIDGKKRCEKKLPLWFETPGIYYPPKLSVEQASSDQTAVYKSGLIAGNSLIDLTGGFGVDSLYFSQAGAMVTHCEINAQLSDIARHNAEILGAKTITFIAADGMEQLRSSNQAYGTIYIDPSRRVHSRKVFFLADCEPNVPENIDLLFSKAPRILLKTSPLLDLSSGLKELRNVSQIHIISIKNDCKELLWVMDREFSGEAEITCTAIGTSGANTFRFTQSEEKRQEISSYAHPQKYLYEPDASLLKAGCFKLLTSRFDVQKLHRNSHLYTSENLVNSIPGKTFEIINVFDYKIFGREAPVNKANIIARNFPLQPADIKKKHKLNDGGNDYLFFTTNQNDRLIVIWCKRHPV